MNELNISNEVIELWMRLVLDKGWAGVRQGQFPFAAAIYSNESRCLALEHNLVSEMSAPSRHAEVCAIDAACKKIGRTQLSGSWLVSSGEPCPMCFAAAAIADVETIVFGANADVVENAGFGSFGLNIDELVQATNYKPRIVRGVLSREAERLLLSNPSEPQSI